MDLVLNAWSVYPLVTVLIIFILLLLSFLLFQISSMPIFHSLSIYWVFPLLIAALFFSSSIHNSIYFIEKLKNSQLKSAYISKKKLDENNLNELSINQNEINNIKSAKAGKNLVLIYLESLEKIYQDNNVFNNLTPNIYTYNQESIVFNGLHQYKGTGWTIAGIVSSQCGTPLLFEYNTISSNDIMANGFLNKAICLGDILQSAGYYQVYLGGANKKFGGKVNFLSTHGYNKVKGVNDLKQQLQDPSYLSSWGMYDDSLFKLASLEFNRLAKLKQPFNLTLLTLDTHHPVGHASKSCKPYKHKDNSILHAVHCTDQLLKQFIDKISQNPAYKDTVVVLFSDHLSMRNEAEKYYPSDYKRDLYFAILNSGQTGEINKKASHMDVTPTLLDIMGVDHNYQFLMGQSLLKQSQIKPTNIKEAGTEQSDEKILLIKHINSTYFTHYNNQLAYEGDNIIKQGKDVLLVADKPLKLPFGESELLPNDLERSRAILVFFNDKGIIEHTQLTDIDTLPYLLYAAKGSNFLLIMPNRKLPFDFTDKLNPADKVQVFMGNLSAQVVNVVSFARQSELKISTKTFNQLLASLMDSKSKHKNKSQKNSLLNGFCSKPTSNSAYVNHNKKQIVLPVVKVGNDFFRAVLSKNKSSKKNEQILILDSLQKIERAFVQTSAGYCYAYYSDYKLYIPYLQLENQKSVLQLSLKSEAPILFAMPTNLMDKI